MTLSKAYNALFYATMAGPTWRGLTYPNAEEKTKLDNDLKAQLDNVTKYLLHFKGDYLTGEHYTPADSAVFAFLSQVVDHGHYSLDAHPELKAWYERVSSKPGPSKIRANCAQVWESTKKK